MSNKFSSLRVQIFLALTSLLLLLLVWLFFYLTIENRSSELNTYTFEVQEFSSDFSKNNQNFQSFLLSGYKDEEFYTSNNTSSLTSYIKNLKDIKLRALSINSKAQNLNINVNDNISYIQVTIDSLIDIATRFRSLVRQRGFKDYGQEGRMRLKAHRLEQSKKLDQTVLLQLRRHEKDYLMRGEVAYAKKLRKLVDSTMIYENLSKGDRELLLGYKNDFDSLIKTNQKLGILSSDGMYASILNYHGTLSNNLSVLTQLTKQKVTALDKRLFYYQLLQTFLIALICILVTRKIIIYFTRDIKTLTADILSYINSNFKPTDKSDTKDSRILEIQVLQRSYALLKQKISQNIRHLERTTDVAKKNADFKSQFLANMSHEIRSPLNGIIGMLNILKWQSLDKKQNECVEIAENSADHLLNLVNMILDHSKLEAGKVVLEYQSIDLKVELEKLIKLFRYQAQDKNIVFKYTFDNAISSHISCDILRLQQVLINLLDNAVKFTENGFIHLDVKLLEHKDKRYKVAFTLQDTGVGIDDTETSKLLKAFEQADLSTTRRYGGTGLGLAIVDQLINMMGGELNIKGTLNEGSRFYFELWLESAHNTGRSSKPELEITFNDQQKVMSKVLIVEDNVINQKVLLKLLERFNFESAIANDGQEALELFDANSYDIIFMDLHMPRLDGYEATKAIKASPRYIARPIPIIAITASAFENDKSKAFAVGMDDFITKPIVFKKLKELIVKYIEDKKISVS